MEHSTKTTIEQTPFGAIPPEIIERILSHVDAPTLAVAIPRVSKQFKDISTDNGAVWQSKCQHIDIIDHRDNITYKKQFFDNTGHLFPIYGYTIGRMDFDELQKDPRANPAQQSVLGQAPLIKPHNLVINDMEFCCGKLTDQGIDTTWSSVEFQRGVSDLPPRWKSMGCDLDGSFNDYCNFFLLRHSNLKMWHVRWLLGVLNARISTIVKEGDLYFEIFVNIRVEGAADDDQQKVVLQRGAARGLQIIWSKDLEQEYPQRIAASAGDVAPLRQQFIQRRQEKDKLKRLWTRLLSNLRSDDANVIKGTLSDLKRILLLPNAESHPQLKSKELLRAVHKFMRHENEELEMGAGHFFITFIKRFPKDAGLISKENLGLPSNANSSENQTNDTNK